MVSFRTPSKPQSSRYRADALSFVINFITPFTSYASVRRYASPPACTGWWWWWGRGVAEVGQFFRKSEDIIRLSLAWPALASSRRVKLSKKTPDARTNLAMARRHSFLMHILRLCAHELRAKTQHDRHHCMSCARQCRASKRTGHKSTCPHVELTIQVII